MAAENYFSVEKEPKPAESDDDTAQSEQSSGLHGITTCADYQMSTTFKEQISL